MSEDSPLLDAVIVGAGISGLSAAYQLQRLGFARLAVLEAKDRVGGRTYTVQNPRVNYVDLGGAYIGLTQLHVHRMLRDLQLKTYKVDESRDILLYDFDSKYRRQFANTDRLKIGSWLDNLDVNHLLRQLDVLGEQINIHEPWNSPNARLLDHKTYGQFVDETCWTARGRRFAKHFININITSEPYETSLLFFLWYIRQCGGVRRIISTSNGGQDSKVVGGSQQISERIADKVGQTHIHLSDAVFRIWYDKKGASILNLVQEPLRTSLATQLNSAKGTFCLIQTLSGKQYVARKVILAMPPVLQSKIHFDPPLPPMRNQLLQRNPMGAVTKVIIYYEKRFWNDLDLCGSFMFLSDDAERSPVFLTLDDTKPDGSKPAIIGFVTADKCRKLIGYSKDKRKQLLARAFANALKDERALHPIHYEEHNFMEDPYISGCYTAVCPPGTLTNYGHTLRQCLANAVFFAGTETATSWSGYMNGAIQAGERAARELAVSLGKLQPRDIWVDEPDLPEYPHHEFAKTYYEMYAPSVGGLVRASVLLATVGTLIVFHQKVAKSHLFGHMSCAWLSK